MDLIDRLAEHKTLSGTPRAELEWLVAHGELRSYERGSRVVTKSTLVSEMVVILTGRIAVHFAHGTGRVHKLESFAGDITGLLPYSRLGMPPGDAVVVESADMLAVHRDYFPELVRECPEITARVVHTMIDRARVSAAANWQDEKMMSLGRLAAGFAHQLNNPASAAMRSAKQIGTVVTAVGEAAYELGQAGLNDEQHAQVIALLAHCAQPASEDAPSAIERADREDRILEWLASHNADTPPATALAYCNVRIDQLDALAKSLPDAALAPALRWIGAAQSSQSLATQVEQASSRIYDHVAGLKRFTSMDRAAVPQPVNLAEGLADTVAVLAGRAAHKSVVVRLDVAPDLQKVTAHSADLNQAWSNLIENAIDAAPTDGHVSVNASSLAETVVVSVIDDGPGITPEVEARMFDPFFTTKGVGEGIGFGLDIARRIVRMYDGEIEVDTCAGRTEFRVRLPALQTETREQ